MNNIAIVSSSTNDLFLLLRDSFFKHEFRRKKEIRLRRMFVSRMFGTEHSNLVKKEAIVFWMIIVDKYKPGGVVIAGFQYQ